MEYPKCSSGVKKGDTVSVHLRFGLGIARYKLSVWEELADGWHCRKVLEKDGSSEDARKDEFDVVVDWSGRRLFHFPAHITYPAPKGAVSTTIEVWSGPRKLGSSKMDGVLVGGGELPIDNGIILEVTESP